VQGVQRLTGEGPQGEQVGAVDRVGQRAHLGDPPRERESSREPDHDHERHGDREGQNTRHGGRLLDGRHLSGGRACEIVQGRGHAVERLPEVVAHERDACGLVGDVRGLRA
jgi:hypothetical protein